MLASRRDSLPSRFVVTSRADICRKILSAWGIVVTAVRNLLFSANKLTFREVTDLWPITLCSPQAVCFQFKCFYIFCLYCLLENILFHIWWLMVEGKFRKNSKVRICVDHSFSKMRWKAKEIKTAYCVTLDCCCLPRCVSSRLLISLANLSPYFACMLHCLKWMHILWFIPNVSSIFAHKKKI
jgi:hypothetical protein